jgi:hypothetical protein
MRYASNLAHLAPFSRVQCASRRLDSKALILVAARLRHVAATKWGTKRYLQMDRLAEVVVVA